MKVLIPIDRIDPNPHRDLERNPVDPAQVAKVIDSISRTGFWENLVVRPHPNQEGRYQLAHGHHRIAACKEAGVTEAELSVMDLSDYDMLCCMIDENSTQRQITPTILFNHVVAAIRLAENMLRSTDTVEQFNAWWESHLSSGKGVKPWRNNEYEKAKKAISEDGDGLGVWFIKPFMPPGTTPRDETLQVIVKSHYAEQRELAATKLAAEAEVELQKAQELKDPKKSQEALRKKAKAQAQLDRASYAGVKRDLLEKLDATSKMGDVARLVKDNKIPEQYHAELIELAANWSADSQTTHKAGTSILIRGGIWWENLSGEYSERMRAIKERLKQQKLTERLGSRPLHKVAAEIISDYARALRKTKEPAEHLKMVAEHFGSMREKELQQVQDYLIRLDGVLTDKANEVKAMIRGNNVLLQAREKEVNPPHESLQIEMQRDVVLAEMDEPMDGIIL